MLKFVKKVMLAFLLHFDHAFENCLQTGPSVTSVVDWGVNYRALNDLFNISQKRHSSITYEIAVQMVEIYNEQVRDLLSNGNVQKRYPSKFYLPPV